MGLPADTVAHRRGHPYGSHALRVREGRSKTSRRRTPGTMSIVVALAALFGLLIGSFLNVCIVRLPEEESVVAPRSHCRSCGIMVAWHDNIPVLSWIVLGGRCRSCGERIPARYMLVEVLTALLFAAVAAQGLPAAETAFQFALVSAMVVVTFIDIDHFLILDVITYPAIAVSPLVAWAVGHVSVADSVLGIVVGGGMLWAFAWTYERIRGHEGLGFGDVKLLAMIGGLQGWEATLFSLLVGAVVGSAVGLALIVARRGRMDMAVPFGPFLAFGSLLYMFDGPGLIVLYLEHTAGV